MGATSATGTGQGDSNKATTTKLAIWANGPQILIAGVLASEESEITSPPTPTGSFTFPIPFPGSGDNYCVIPATLNGGTCYITEKVTENGEFTGFSVITEFECDVMFIVVPMGIRAIANI